MNERLASKTMLACLALIAAVVLSYFFFDRQAAFFAQGIKNAGTFELAKSISLLANNDVLTIALAAGLILGAANQLGPTPKDWARSLLCVCLTLCAAIVASDALKFIFGRCRPELLLSEDLYGFTWFADKGAYNSFPSGHTTRIFALCAALALIFRRLAVPLLLIAVLVGASRVFALKHYPSDVLTGAFVGVASALWTRALFLGRKIKPGTDH